MVVGAVTGVLSGLGIGGGSLLILWMTVMEDIAQLTASGINLCYFLCCAPPALVSHAKNHLIVWRAVGWCALSGCIVSLCASLLASSLSPSLLRRAFGVLLLVLGLRELFHKKKPDEE